jgi:hypothetical protein
MKVKFVLAAFAAAGLAAAVWAETPPQPPAPPAPATTPAAPAEPDPKDKVVCKKFKTTGSRLATEKICKTQREWDAEAEEARKFQQRGIDQQAPPPIGTN